MHDTVYLDDLRCDGSGHGGCQAGCLLYWKEAWLRRVEVHPGAAPCPTRLARARSALPRRDANGAGGTASEEVWRCQATEAFKASEPLKTSNLAQYWRELTNGNFGLPAVHQADGARGRDGAVVPRWAGSSRSP